MNQNWSSKRPRTSKIWNFFTFVDQENAICNKCNQRISHKSTISNLKKHLLRRHPKEAMIANILKFQPQTYYVLGGDFIK